MPWWGWLIITSLACFATAIALLLYVRRAYFDTLVYREEMARVRAEQLRVEVQQERAVAEQLGREAHALATRLKLNQTWYENARRFLSKETRDEFEKLAGDPAAIDARLDRILKSARANRVGIWAGAADKGGKDAV